MPYKRIISRTILSISIVLSGVMLMACSGHTAKRAGEGAATGAVIGAAGGLVSALVFGGNVGEAAARGAVWGGTTGAVAGGIAGSQQQAVANEQQNRDIEKLRAELGEDAFNGLSALMECKHEVALAYGQTAAKSDNKNYALAGLWIEILAYADSRQENKARELYPDLITSDPDISSDSQAEETMRKAMQELMDIRKGYNLPTTCL